MTQYSTLGKSIKGKKTTFIKGLRDDLCVIESVNKPTNFDHVLFLGHDFYYGDVFKAWDDGHGDDYTIFFGVAGEEFNQ